nr:hypothetical protein [Tanacetum cinerariifolium]
MTSFDYRLNPRYAIKECLSCGDLYTRDCSCSKGSVEDKILVPKPHKNGASTNVVNAPREPFVVKHDHGVKSSQNPPHIDKCCCECGNALDGIFCQQCICKSCGKGAYIGYNCPPKVLIISNPEPCNQTMNNELPQTLRSFDTTCYSDKENSVPCISKPNFVDESSNIFNHLHNLLYIIVNSAGAMLNMKQEEKRIKEEQVANDRYWKIPVCCDDDDDYDSAITPVLSIEEPIDSLSIPDTMCDVHLVNNPTPLEAKDHFEIIMNSNDDISSNDDDSLYNENIEYVEASPYDSELVNLEAAEIVIPEVEEIEDDNLREKLLNVYLLIANIEALNDDPTQSSEFLTKSSSTSPKSF